jgi:adenine-specific DNA-methyltransferase
VLYEIDELLLPYLQDTMAACRAACDTAGIAFQAEIRNEDFLAAAVQQLTGDLYSSRAPEEFSYVILNPPYRKIHTDSPERRLLRRLGIETSNLYTGFLAVAARLLGDNGQLVAITPRSFCNGPYFLPFRRAFLERVNFTRFHIFESRQEAFSNDDVLQENVIFRAVRTPVRPHTVTVTTSNGPNDTDVSVRQVPYEDLVSGDDRESIIHLAADDLSHQIGVQVQRLPATLADLNLTVSTGRVVDFRARALLRLEPGPDTAPLIFPGHFSSGFIAWPKPTSKKPNAIALTRASDDLLVPTGFYVLVKRFSAKEEPRRVVAAVFDPGRVPGDRVAFENHLNYYHQNGAGLPKSLAMGLAAFLNSTLVDSNFRQFSGHTQVNASDLRRLRYPTSEQLSALGKRIGRASPQQGDLDQLIREEILPMTNDPTQDPVDAKAKIDEALAILQAFDVPRAQQNERSALTLLSLLEIKPTMSWDQASAPLRGITEMMDYFSEHFGRKYAPNTRETVRRQTIHQFVQIGLVLANPDNPKRPINSPGTRYQIDAEVLKLVQTFGSDAWQRNLSTYREGAVALNRLKPQERQMKSIPVRLPDGTHLNLTAGGQNNLVKAILEEFCPRYVPGGNAIYVGDTGDKMLYYDEKALGRLGVRPDKHGKMPDVVVHHRTKNWLVLIEAVTSHGPVDLKRHNELKQLFAGSSAGLVFVTAFETRKAMVKYLGEIAWETEVWVAESPTHVIHFNGERFLGPYE